MQFLGKMALSAVAAAAALAASSAHAALSGAIYEGFGTGDGGFDQFILDNFGPQGAIGAFTSTLVDYGTDSGQSFNSWLNNAGQNDGSTLTGGIGGDQATNFFLTLDGIVHLSAGDHQFSLFSDDGSELYVNGDLVVDDGGPHGPQFAGSVFNAPTGGAYHVRVVFDECCDGAAVLNASLDGKTLTGAPEPATWTMMIGGLGLAGGALRRRRTAVAA